MTDRQLMRLLLVVGDGVSRYTISVTLQRAGYVVAEIDSGEAALERYDRRDHDVVLADLDLPGMNGMELLAGIKARTADAVIVLMTAKPSVESAVHAMRAGASDYLVLPVSSDELRASVERAMLTARRRLRRRRLLVAIERNVAELAQESAGGRFDTADASAALRNMRPPPQAGPGIRLGPFTLAPGKNEVSAAGKSVTLTPTEFDLLVYLAAHHQRVVPCQELVSEVRGYKIDEPEAREIMRPHISHLRRKLRRLHEQVIVVNARGLGYRLDLDAPAD